MKTMIAGLACILLLATATAAAQDKAAKKIYCWEEDGHKVCGDALPADAVDAARTEISARTGHTVRSLARAPTDEERAAAAGDRKSVVVGKRVCVRGDLGGRRVMTKKKNGRKNRHSVYRREGGR